MHEQNDTIQHYGIKGMKWGKRKISEKISEIKDRGAARKDRIKTDADIVRRRRKGDITRKQAKEERWASFHKEQSANKHYKKAYDTFKSKGMDDKKAMRRAYRIVHRRNMVKNAILTKVGSEIIKNPNVVMTGKNIVQAMKNSSFRYVDGKKMANVVSEM